MARQSLAVTTANVDPDTTTAWFAIDLTPDDQAFSVHFTGNGAAGTATIEAALRDIKAGTSERAYRATATVGASRTANDGANGEYHCTVVFTNTGNEWVDTTGLIKGENKWWVGVVGFGTITAGTLTVVPTTRI